MSNEFQRWNPHSPNNVLTAYERLSDECAAAYRRAKRAERNQRTLLIGASIFCGVLAIVAAGGWAAWWRKVKS